VMEAEQHHCPSEEDSGQQRERSLGAIHGMNRYRLLESGATNWTA
jgi:hypothetical protein